MPNPDTDEWKISVYMEYDPKKSWEDVECKRCNGRRKINMHFGSLDEPEDCPECNGKGTKTVQVFPKEPKPVIKQEFLDWMRKSYLEYKLK